MKLVMLIDWGDEYSGYGTDTIPVEYKSKDDLEYDFLALLEDHKAKHEKFLEWRQSIESPYNHKDKFEKFLETWREEFPERSKDGAASPYFSFMGRQFSCDGEIPKIFTLDEWFENYKEQ